MLTEISLSEGPELPSPSTTVPFPRHPEAPTNQSLIDRLFFAKIDEHLTLLRAAQGTTCRWFLTIPKYISWNNPAQRPHHGSFLWIKGNPGTGKSTLIKFLFEEAKFTTKDDSSQITLSFFFLARGTVEEKSTTGLYRSLLYQLFKRVVKLQDSLEWLTTNGKMIIQQNGWDEEALKQTLTRTIQNLGSKSLTIFVDALDECDRRQVAGIVCFFEELCDSAREAEVKLKVCFSSRHYPAVVVQKDNEVILESEIGHTEDIKQYINSKLRLGKSIQAESLRSKILEKSSRIFLWVVLVLRILNSEYPNNAVSIKKISERLNEIPQELNDLFELILTRHRENFERLQICLKWILFANRPLKPQEFYFAVQLGLEKECSGYWDQDDVELDQMEIFARSSSKGLAEVTPEVQNIREPWSRASKVQFIHESVRDFLVGKYEGRWSWISGNFMGHGHEILKSCCLAQLNAFIRQEFDITVQQDSWEVGLPKTISSKFPFLEYAVLNVLEHANSAQQNKISQDDFLIEFPLQQWIFLNNLMGYNVQRYTESASLLYILAEKNLADLIAIHPQRGSCFNAESERYGMPILAALATGSQKAVHTILELQAEIQQEPLLHHLCKQYSKKRINQTYFDPDFTLSPQIIFSYVTELHDEVVLAFFCALGKLDLKTKDSHGQTPLSWAAKNGHETVVKLLLKIGADLESKDNSGQTPLLWATQNRCGTVVKQLLENGANPESKDKYSWTALLWATKNGHEAMIILLLENGADLESKDRYGWTPLSCATLYRHESVVKLLLEKGAYCESKDTIHGRTSLSWAAKHGHETVVKLLLKNGADPKSKDNSGKTPLLWAVMKWHKAVVRLLLEKGADPESKDKNGQTPVSWAARNGCEAVVKLLLQNGASIESKDIMHGWTPLSWAARNGHKAVVKLLLENGANLKYADSHGQTPLLWAVQNGYEAVVKLLLKNGADLESEDSHSQTPLLWAAQNGHEAVVKLLLKNGASLESKDRIHGWTPLSWAAKNGCEAVVKLLLENGADPESKDNSGQTPLLWATLYRHKAVVKLLLKAMANKGNI